MGEVGLKSLALDGRKVRWLACMIVFHLCMHTTSAQIFPGLEGEELTQALREEYTPAFLLDDTQLRDTLYAIVFLQDDTVKCVYSSYARYLPDGTDPSVHLFDNGNNSTSINLEHGWPQSKGAGDGTQGNRNMHHLFPSRMVINGVRADFPFNEVNDQQTQSWFYLGNQMSGIPSSNIDAYSEYGSGRFEPRETFKGDIARAMFYFWTIYRQDAEAADAQYFETQRADLCNWHMQDPVDDFEQERNERIAGYQSGESNPFILDCTLASRAYCPGLEECPTVGIKESVPQDANFNIDFRHHAVSVQSDNSETWSIGVYTINGGLIQQEERFSGEQMSLGSLIPGVYVIVGRSESASIRTLFFMP